MTSGRAAGIIGGLIVVGAACLVLLWRGCRDRQDDVRLDDAHRTLVRDSAESHTQRLATDTAAAHVDTSAHRLAHIDTVFRRVLAAAPSRVDTILAEQVHDTVKIRELVRLVDTLRIRGDSEVKACTDLARDCQTLRVQFGREREAWQSERHDLENALTIAERGRRRWGLGCAGGYGAARVPASGQIIVAPSVACGLAWRW